MKYLLVCIFICFAFNTFAQRRVVPVYQTKQDSIAIANIKAKFKKRQEGERNAKDFLISLAVIGGIFSLMVNKIK